MSRKHSLRSGTSLGRPAIAPAGRGNIAFQTGSDDIFDFLPSGLPRTPAEAADRVPQLRSRISRWDRSQALALLAGLQLEPRYHANHMRLSWASRLVAGFARGDQIVTRTDLTRLLNTDLARGDILRIEDPSEDLFLSPIATRRGEIPILMGTGSHPAFYVDCLVDAFLRIADPQDRVLEEAVEAILDLSRATAARAGLARRIAGEGTPKVAITLPPQSRIEDLAAHVRWTAEALAAEGLSPASLAQFILNEDDAGATLEANWGNAPLDFKPLVSAGCDLILAVPSAISSAVRAAVADHMIKTGRESALSEALLEVQAERLSETRFAQTDAVPTRWAGKEPVRSHLFEYSTGRFLHLEQMVGNFAGWRDYGFGEPHPAGPQRNALIVDSMQRAKAAAEAEADFNFGATLYLMGGWGKGERFDFVRPEALKGWRFMAIEVADAITLSACPDGTPGDFWRIDVLADAVRQQGFGLQNLSGPLNQFCWWTKTDHTLVPQHTRDAVPPLQLVLPTDLLFAARQESAEALDRRAVEWPGGGFRPVVRLAPLPAFGLLEPIYVSFEALQARELLGVSLAGSRPVWLQVARPKQTGTADASYQNWAAALQWLALISPLLGEIGNCEDASPIHLTLEIPSSVSLGGAAPEGQALDDDICIEAGRDHAIVRAGEIWQRGVLRIDNRAELALAAAMLEAMALAVGDPLGREEALRRVRDAVPSSDVRWRHAYRPERAADILRLNNILSIPFREIPKSAGSLVKHGHAIGEDRPPRTIVTGKAPCAALLAELHGQSLAQLLDAITHYDRAELVTAAIAMLQASLADEQQWALTARALRGIHGQDADLLASLAQRSRVNGAIRASSLLAEVAASHAATTGGMRVGEMDYDELSAMALHHFNYCELVPSLAGGRLTPKFIVSPTGDLLYDHSFGETALAPSAAAMHAEQRVRQIADYGWWIDRKPENHAGLDADLLDAIEAEFGVSTSQFGDFSAGLCDLAVAAGTDVLLLRRSELVSRLTGYRDLDASLLARLVDRLTLPCRAGWHEVPRDAHPNDYDLGRFDRPQSMIGRPFLAISDDADSMLAVGPAAVERSFIHNLSGAIGGSLQDRFWSSKVMRSHVGRAANRAGMAFNDGIAEDLRSLGLSAKASVAPWACLNLQATPTAKLLGDIDVLAVSSDSRHVWIIEAKDIKLCRTLGETARRLSDYRGQKRHDGKPDNLLRHLDRVAYIRAHTAELAKRLKLPGIPAVHGLVVVDTPQPMIFVEANPSPEARFVRRRDLAGMDWSPQPRRKRAGKKRR